MSGDRGELVVTMTSTSPRQTREEFPSLRWFSAALALDVFDDDTYETSTRTDLAAGDVVLVSFTHGVQAAYLDADAEDGALAAVMEELLKLEHRHLLDRLYPNLSAVVIVDGLSRPVPDRGAADSEIALLREVADYFDYLTGTVIGAAFPSPANFDQLDPFTLRSERRRLEALFVSLDMSPFANTGAWAHSLDGPNPG